MLRSRSTAGLSPEVVLDEFHQLVAVELDIATTIQGILLAELDRTEHTNGIRGQAPALAQAQAQVHAAHGLRQPVHHGPLAPLGELLVVLSRVAALPIEWRELPGAHASVRCAGAGLQP